MRLRARLREVTPRTVVISLGTNDGPDPRRFAGRIQRALQAIPATDCVVWLDINRPPRKGRYEALNRVLYEAAERDPRLVVVHWDRAVRHGNVALPDGLHPDAGRLSLPQPAHRRRGRARLPRLTASREPAIRSAGSSPRTRRTRSPKHSSASATLQTITTSRTVRGRPLSRSPRIDLIHGLRMRTVGVVPVTSP